jgi:hypothetical protein
METLDAFFTSQGKRDIHTLAQYIQAHVDENWARVFAENRDEMIRRYPEIGDSVYGIYGTRLFRDVHAQLKTVGLRATPRLPGGFTVSREWGDDESDRQRWMWSKIADVDGKPLGTIAVAFFHDHIQVRIPRGFKIMGVEATGKAGVIAALSRLSPDFADAQEARIEIAQYLAQLAENQGS